jgi:hypothetical protein
MTYSATPAPTTTAKTARGRIAAVAAGVLVRVVCVIVGLSTTSTMMTAPTVKSSHAPQQQLPAITLPASVKNDLAQCLADKLDTQDGVHEDTVKSFLEGEGQVYTRGGHFEGYLQAFKASATPNSLDDGKHRKVTAAKARVDGLVDFILHLRTSDVCDKTTSGLASKELLFAVDEGKCKKSEAAISALMSNEEGKGLVARCYKGDPQALKLNSRKIYWAKKKARAKTRAKTKAKTKATARVADGSTHRKEGTRRAAHGRQPRRVAAKAKPKPKPRGKWPKGKSTPCGATKLGHKWVWALSVTVGA